MRATAIALLICVPVVGAACGDESDATASDGPPQVDGGPPHVVNGMVDDLVVTER